MLLYVQKLTTIFQKLIIFLLLLTSLSVMGSEKITLGITGVALKEDISTLIKLKDYLKEKTGLDIKIKFARSYSIMRHLILDDNVNVAYICGATYVDLMPSKKIKLLALPTVDHKPYYYSLIIAKKGTKYKTIDDFKNTVFAMSDPESNSGSLVPIYEISKRGYNYNHFFKRIIYTYDHGESVEAVLDDYVQGASVDSVIYQAFLKNNPKQRGKLKIVQKFGPFPIPPFVISKKVSQEAEGKIQKALIDMDKTDSGKQILNAMAIDSFIKPNNLSYEKIEKIKFFLNSKK
jgi:phosphonate transport system substrate-binding protein